MSSSIYAFSNIARRGISTLLIRLFEIVRRLIYSLIWLVFNSLSEISPNSGIR